DWSKWSDQITLSVFEITTTTATSSPATDTGGGSAGGGSGGGGAPPANNVSTDEINNAVNKILNFLQSREDANGKIVDAGTTDWAIMSFAANNQYADEVRNGGASLFEYARDHAFDDASTDPNKCATYPRRVLALLAGGVSTEDALIAHQTDKINECHVGASYGLAGINDDIFALIVLLAVGESPQSAIVQDIINTMKQSQTDAGNFTGFSGPDMTGAAINALIYAKVKGANVDQLIINEAKEYLKNEQLEDGSWVSDGSYAPMATSWVVMGINALGEGQSDWVRNNKNPWNVLTENLRANGSYESASSPGEVEWFATKYAVPALLGRSWPIILAPRAIPPPNNIVNNFVGGGAAPIDSATATSTINTSTSTININQTSTTTLDVNTSTVRQIEPENEIETENEATAQEEAPLGFESPVSESGAGGGWLESATARDYLTNEPEGDKIEEAAPVAVVIEELNKEGDEYALQTFSVDTGSVSVKKTAKGFFAVSLAASGGMGLYLALRFLRTIV
ncbi:MAG: prenyltransferase/squalene oxidase repeat-containing protein, partial [Patescibacteria group bacterium]